MTSRSQLSLFLRPPFDSQFITIMVMSVGGSILKRGRYIMRQQHEEILRVSRHPKWQTFVESSDEMWLDKNNCFHNRWRQHRDEIIHQYPLIQWQGEQRTHWPIRGLTARHRNIILQFTHETWITLYRTCSCLSSHWSRQIMWPEYSPLIGQLPWPRGFWLAAESQNNKHWWGERRNNRKQFMTEDYLWICLA